jgi:hypothetical protein
MAVMADTGSDFTHTFRRLSLILPPRSAEGSAAKADADSRFLTDVLGSCAGPAVMAEAARPRIAPQQLKARGAEQRAEPSAGQRMPVIAA